MKNIFKAMFIIQVSIIGFTHIAIIHVLNIIWEFKLNPRTKWRDGDGKRCRGNFTQRYEAWQKIIEKSSVFQF